MINFRDKSRYKSSIVLNLTSLIDVLFLLVIFFLLTTKFVMSDSIDLSVSTINKTVNSSATEDAIIITLIGNEKFILSDNQYRLDQMQEKIGEVIRSNKSKDIVLVSKEGANVQNMVTAMDKIRAAGGNNISLAE